MSSGQSEIVRHLLFHKALLGEDDASERIDHYVGLVEQSPDGEHVAISDPFDRAIALAFELVLDEHLDPWRIDLVQFAALYLRRLREAPGVDLITAGRLVLMAWRILRMQSDDVKDRAEPPPAEAAPEPDPWFGVEAEDQGDPAVLYNHAVIEEGQVPFEEKIRHKGDRKVTFMELLDALEEARLESEARAEIGAKREAEKAARRAAGEASVGGQVHKEDQEAEIAEVWSRIARLNGHPIPLEDLRSDRSRDEVVKTLVSVLFLARAAKVKLWQDDFPYGPIFVQNAGANGPGPN